MNINDYSADFVAAPYDIGDVVVLRGQDQLMTVEDVCACGNVDVVWFAGNEDAGWTGPHRDTFDAAMLVNLDDQDDN